MATLFSWSDTVQIAFGSCLPCLKPAVNLGDDDSGLHQENNPAINRIQRARPDELQGLLADPDTDIEAETLSLHSNPGRTRNKKKRRPKLKSGSSKNPRRITLFGYDLFGRSGSASVQLPDDGVDALYPNEGPRQQQRARSGSLTPTGILTAQSTATFDSDAAPLDADAIAAMSSPTVAANAAAQAAEAEAQRLREKEERRQRRREKKERKRLAEALASGEGDAFEGFQGSGADYAAPPHPRPTSDSGSGSAFSGSTQEPFGTFVSAVQQQQYPQNDDDDDDAADLDGGMYASKGRRGLPPSRLNGGSDSQSRTSASDKGHQLPDARHALAHIQSQSFGVSASRVHSPSQLQFSSSASASSDGGQVPKSKSKTSRSSRTARSQSSAGTSQSQSIPSPVSPAFVEPQAVVSPSTIEQGQGFFDLEDEHPIREDSLSAHEPPQSHQKFPSTRIGGGGTGFPSTGFGGANSTRTRDFGAFLAHRGDDDVPAGAF